LFSIFEQHDRVSRAVFMLQREVAERIAAAPGGRDYGVLSVLLQTVGKVERVFDVPAGAFYPPPKIDSCVVRIDVLPAPNLPNFDRSELTRLVKSAFASRRKTLSNTLSAARIAGKPEVRLALAAAGIDGGRRAESLSPSEFLALAKALRRDQSIG
jgi:16S rRNA (adenine1518-N6/adenine1519-N6)-dimethyltransferase